MYVKKKKREPIHITLADIERAYEKVDEFKRFVERGKTIKQIFKDLLKLVQIEE